MTSGIPRSPRRWKRADRCSFAIACQNHLGVLPCLPMLERRNLAPKPLTACLDVPWIFLVVCKPHDPGHTERRQARTGEKDRGPIEAQ